MTEVAPNKTWPDRQEFRNSEELQTGIVAVDPKFRELLAGDAANIRHEFVGTEWAEGPAWVPSKGDTQGYLVFSDVPNNRMLKFNPETKLTTVFREPSRYSNGNTVDNSGRLVTCEHQSNSVVRLESDGQLTVLADRYEGNRLNSPNDLCVKSDRSIWFTDPPYGILSDREGNKRESEVQGNYVYRLDPDTRDIHAVITEMDRPNGIAFAPNERVLYVADTGAPRHIAAFDVSDDGKSVSDKRVFAVVRPGAPDGFRTDTRGNVWTSAHDGVHCYSPDGVLLGKLLIAQQRTANCAFGGDDMKTLYITADTSVYSVRLSVAGTK